MEASLRDTVPLRAHNRCEYCRLPDDAYPLPFHLEHIIARQHGGDHEAENLAWACDRCNAYKGPNLSSIDPLTHQVVDLYHPRHKMWQDRFAVHNAEIIGLTPNGRATVRLLQMNMRHRVELRRELIAQGLFD